MAMGGALEALVSGALSAVRRRGSPSLSPPSLSLSLRVCAVLAKRALDLRGELPEGLERVDVVARLVHHALVPVFQQVVEQQEGLVDSPPVLLVVLQQGSM